MSTQGAKGWAIVDVLDPENPAVLMAGGKSLQARPLSCVYRGPTYRAVPEMIQRCLRSRKRVTAMTLPTRGHRELVIVKPLMVRSGEIVAVCCWTGSPTFPVPPSPETATVTWSLGSEVLELAFEDLPLAELFDSESIRLDDLLDQTSLADASRLRRFWSSTSADFASIEFDVVAGLHSRRLRAVGRWDDTTAVPRFVGTIFRVPSRPQIPYGTSDVMLLRSIFSSLKLSALILDVAHGRVERWLTPPPPAVHWPQGSTLESVLHPECSSIVDSLLSSLPDGESQHRTIVIRMLGRGEESWRTVKARCITFSWVDSVQDRMILILEDLEAASGWVAAIDDEERSRTLRVRLDSERVSN